MATPGGKLTSRRRSWSRVADINPAAPVARDAAGPPRLVREGTGIQARGEHPDYQDGHRAAPRPWLSGRRGLWRRRWLPPRTWDDHAAAVAGRRGGCGSRRRLARHDSDPDR